MKITVSLVSSRTPQQLVTTLAAPIRWCGLMLCLLGGVISSLAQAPAPTVIDPHLTVKTVISGLSQPTTMAFLDDQDFLVLEKASGKVQRVTNGKLVGTVLDLWVNSASERGLLGIALHPDFPETPLVYLYWTESLTHADSTELADVELLGNRVDRFVWTGNSLIYDRNIIRLHAFQADQGQPLRGNHNGGILAFEQDRQGQREKRRQRYYSFRRDDDEMARLFIIIGDNGRRGWLQNILSGAPVPDDQFGGPAPDNAHLTGVVLRLNEDGSTPRDNPFWEYGASVGGEVGANYQRIFSFGRRNSFGMAVDPYSGHLWIQENGDDSFDELNRVDPGSNGGWTQIMGPVSRIAEYKAIEVSRPGGLQQNRWPPTLIADTPFEALQRLFVIPESKYTDPQLSWKYAVAPAGIGFLKGRGLGRRYEGDLFVGAARTNLANGYLFRVPLSEDRRTLAPGDPRLADRVADNNDKFDISESENLLFGRDFGIGTDIKTGPNGNLFVVSLSNGAVYEIARRR